MLSGTFDDERVKQGNGSYIWMGPTSADDDTPVEKSKYEGNYINGQKSGIGKMTYPNGDVYEGEWNEDKMHGDGTYVYKKTGDIYSGSWVNGKKQGYGRYEFEADRSMMVGNWENGQFKTGKWELKGAGHYEGTFKLGRPIGTGKYTFASGLTQLGSYDEKKRTEEDEELDEEEAASRPPNVAWKGQSIVAI